MSAVDSFIFERSWVQALASRLAVLIEVYNGFSQSLQANVGIVS
jgi:hypothetical protein